ncbi:hypothetical protein HGA91_02985 [candidate division WWE3 bacterium]|nr:hypothetical protein [candidate division WWE3 bacterium]
MGKQRRWRLVYSLIILTGVVLLGGHQYARASTKYFSMLPMVRTYQAAQHTPQTVEYCAEGLGQLYNQSIGVCGNNEAALALEMRASLEGGEVKPGEFAGPIYGVQLQISSRHAQNIGYPNGATLYELGGSKRFPERDPIASTPVTFDLPSGRYGLGQFVEPPPTTPTTATPTSTTAPPTPSPTTTATATPTPTYCQSVGMLDIPGWNHHICGDQQMVDLAQGLLPGQVRAGTFQIWLKELPADHGYPSYGAMFYGNSPGVEEMSVPIPLGQQVTIQLSSDSGGVNPIWGLGPGPLPVDACPGDLVNQLTRMSTGVCGDTAAETANTRESAQLGQLVIAEVNETVRLWINPDFAGKNPGHGFVSGACLYKAASTDAVYIPSGGSPGLFILSQGTWGISTDTSCHQS